MMMKQNSNLIMFIIGVIYFVVFILPTWVNRWNGGYCEENTVYKHIILVAYIGIVLIKLSSLLSDKIQKIILMDFGINCFVASFYWEFVAIPLSNVFPIRHGWYFLILPMFILFIVLFILHILLKKILLREKFERKDIILFFVNPIETCLLMIIKLVLLMYLTDMWM